MLSAFASTTFFAFPFLTTEPDADSAAFSLPFLVPEPVAFGFPFVLLTGDADDADEDSLTSSSPDHCLIQPFKSPMVYFNLTSPQISISDLRSELPVNHACISSKHSATGNTLA